MPVTETDRPCPLCLAEKEDGKRLEVANLVILPNATKKKSLEVAICPFCDGPTGDFSQCGIEMSRADGTFPAYVKLTLNPDDEPTGYWDRGHRACQTCQFKWPNMQIFNPSPCCRTALIVRPGPPEITWPKAIKAVIKARFERFYADWDGDTPDELILLDHSIEIPLTAEEEEWLRQASEELDLIINEHKTTQEC